MTGLAQPVGVVYTLKNGKSAMDFISTSDIDVDLNRMCAGGIFVSNALDRQGDRIQMSGIRTANHQKNPVALWNHGLSKEEGGDAPIGKTEDENGTYTVSIGEQFGKATTFFTQSLRLAVQTFALIAERIVRAQSIGFDTISAQPLVFNGQRLGNDLLEIEMVETSWTAIGANPEAVRSAMHKNWDGNRLAPALLQLLEPHAAALKVWSPGATLKSNDDIAEVPAPPSLEDTQGPGTNTGHGHIWERPDGIRMRCTGTMHCRQCQADLAKWGREKSADEPESLALPDESKPVADELKAPADELNAPESESPDDSEADRLDAMADILGGLLARGGMKCLAATGRKDWDDAKHPRGQPGNAGQFGPGGGGGSKPKKPASPKTPKPASKPAAKPVPDAAEAVAPTSPKPTPVPSASNTTVAPKKPVAKPLASTPMDKPTSGRKPKNALLSRVIQMGGIDAAKLGRDYNVQEDFWQSGLGGIFRKGGLAFDDVAAILESEGHIKTPSHLNSDDHLMQALKGHVASLHDDVTAELKDAEAAYYKELEDAKRYADESEVAEALRSGKASGKAEGEAGPPEGDAHELAGEAPSGEGLDFDFGANVETPKPAPAKPLQSSAPRAGGKQAQAQAKAAIEQIVTGAITAESHKALVGHMAKLTVPQLREIAAAHNLKCPERLKGKVLEKLAHHFNSKIIKTGSVDVAKVAKTLAPFAKVKLGSDAARFAQADYLTIKNQYGTLAGHRIKELATNALRDMKDTPPGEGREGFRQKLAGFAWMANQAAKDGITGQVEPPSLADPKANFARIQLGERLRGDKGASWGEMLLHSVREAFDVSPGISPAQTWEHLREGKFSGDRLDTVLRALRPDYGTMNRDQLAAVVHALKSPSSKITDDVVAAAMKGSKAWRRKSGDFDESKHPRAQDGRFGSGAGHSGSGGGGGTAPSESKPAGDSRADKIAAHAAKLKEQHSDAAADKVRASIDALKGSSDPQAEAKIGVLTEALSHLEKPAEKPTPAEPPKPPRHGIVAGNIPNRLIRYEDGKPTKIHDYREGDAQTEDNHFETSARPGILRSDDGRVLGLQLDKAESDHDMVGRSGMVHRQSLSPDFGKAVHEQYDPYFDSLADQVEDVVGSDPDDIEQIGDVADELTGHLQQAERELTELYSQPLTDIFGDHADVAGLKDAIGEHFAEVYDDIANMKAAAEDGDNDAVQEYAGEIASKLHSLSSYAKDARDEKASEADDAIEQERSDAEDELNDVMEGLEDVDQEDGQEAADEFNSRSEFYSIEWDEDGGQWVYEEKAYRPRGLKNATGWDEGKHPRAGDGRFGSGGGHGSTADKPAGNKPSGSDNSAPKSVKERAKAGLSKLAKLGSKGVAAAGHVEHAAVAAIKRNVATLPPALQKPVVGAWNAFMSSYTAGQAAVLAVAKERGNTPEQVDRISKICCALDVIGAKGGPAGFAKAGLSGGALFATGFVPVGSTAYLAFATATNPLATYRAAKKAVAAVIEKGIGNTAREIGRDLVTLRPDEHHKSRNDKRGQAVIAVMLDMVKSASDPDAWMATFFAALDAVDGDVVQALKVTRAATA